MMCSTFNSKFLCLKIYVVMSYESVYRKTKFRCRRLKGSDTFCTDAIDSGSEKVGATQGYSIGKMN